jgi:hypothetical protein
VGEPARELGASGWERLQPAGARGAALEIWRETADAAARLLGGDAAALGVGKPERQNAKGIPLAWIPVDKIARALGVKEYELYLHGERERARAGVTAVALGASHMERLTPLTRARVARRMALMRDRAGCLETADPAQLELFFAACARAAKTSWQAPSRPAEAQVEEWSRLVLKEKRAKKALAVLGGRFAELGDLKAWRRELMRGAARAALAVSGDLAATLAELGTDLRSELGQDLARYAVSLDLAAVRRELGLRT